MTDEDLVRLRRSLAMAPSLPVDAIEALLNEVEMLRRDRRGFEGELADLAERIQELLTRSRNPAAGRTASSATESRPGG